jgi:hypothetical protein
MERGWTSWLWVTVCIGVVVIAAAARIAGAMNDLWLDEILALAAACKLSSVADTFTKLHSEVNHHLYTLYLFVLRPENNWFDCRIPSLLAGIGTVVMAGTIGRRRSRVCGLFAMVLFGSSYVMILYSSEARGYALAVFFALAAFDLLDRYLETRRWPLATGFSVCVILGFLSQLTFVSFYLATVVWALYRLRREAKGRLVRAMLSCHAAPSAFLAAFYLIDIRRIRGIGGTPSLLLRSCSDALVWAVGSPPDATAQAATGAVAVAVLVAGIWLLRRDRSDLCLFFPVVIVVFPVLLVIVRGSDVIYVRYFIIAIAFLLLLFSFCLGRLYEQEIGGKPACATLLTLFVAINGLHVVSLFEHGRGQYSEAIRYIMQQSERSPITIGSNHDFRVATELTFYWPSDQRSRAKYYRQNSWPPRGPEWVIRQEESFEDPTSPPTVLTDDRQNEYLLVKRYPSAPLSGLHWFLYHNRSQ